MEKVTVVPHDPRWCEEFEAESKHVASCLGENVVAAHHIGSTAIPGIYAKPVIDILVEVSDIHLVDERGREMESLGYEVKGEYGISGRRYFRKESCGVRTHHVHVFETGSPHIERHIAFRDHMLAHPDDAKAYSDLKRKLAEAHPTNIDAYMDGKEPFIQEVDRRARA